MLAAAIRERAEQGAYSLFGWPKEHLAVEQPEPRFKGDEILGPHDHMIHRWRHGNNPQRLR